MKEWREGREAQQGKQGVGFSAKLKKKKKEWANYCTNQDVQSICACLWVLCLTCSTHTRPHGQSVLHFTIQHKTSFVAWTAKHDTTLPHPPPLPLNHCAPPLQLSAKRLPGQQSRLNGFIKPSSASIYCLTRACVNTVLDCPDLQYITTSQCYTPHSFRGLAGLHTAYISSSLVGLWESWGSWKERQAGAGIEYQAEKERTPRKCGVEKQ